MILGCTAIAEEHRTDWLSSAINQYRLRLRGDMMKRYPFFVFLLLLLLSLSACAQQVSVYTVERDGVNYTVDTENATVFDGENSYTYKLIGDEEDYELTVVYPDGSSFTYTRSGAGSIWGASEDYDESRYVSGELLCAVITEGKPQEISVGKILISLILFALGVFHIVCPRVAWLALNGWRFRNRRNVEPSELLLILSRAGGVVYVIAAVILFYV